MTTGRRFLALFTVLFFGVVVGACGDDAATTTTSSTAADQTVPPAPTELRFTVEGLAGFQSKALVVVVSNEAGIVAGSICVQIDSDPWSGMGVVRLSAVDNPCDFNSPNDVVLSTEGSYSYLAGVYTPGQQSPEACVTGTVTVDGPTEVALSGADFVAGCAG